MTAGQCCKSVSAMKSMDQDIYHLPTVERKYILPSFSCYFYVISICTSCESITSQVAPRLCPFPGRRVWKIDSTVGLVCCVWRSCWLPHLHLSGIHAVIPDRGLKHLLRILHKYTWSCFEGLHPHALRCDRQSITFAVEFPESGNEPKCLYEHCWCHTY